MELNNKAIGRNLSKFRMLRDVKASDLAERIGMKEGNYTKYERGESKITIDLVQKIATALEVDPIQILATSPDRFVETVSNNTVATGAFLLGTGDANLDIKGDYVSVDKLQQEMQIKLLAEQVELTKKVIELLSKK
jgi:transcriptional regulator with XRE-family HTH domain